jgi:hypothetical protein
MNSETDWLGLSDFPPHPSVQDEYQLFLAGLIGDSGLGSGNGSSHEAVVAQARLVDAHIRCE